EDCESLAAFGVCLEFRGAIKDSAAGGFGGLRMLVHASEGRVEELLSIVIGRQIERTEQLLHTIVFGSGEVPILIHPEDEKICEGRFLFVRKTLGIHATRIDGGGNRVNLRKVG